MRLMLPASQCRDWQKPMLELDQKKISGPVIRLHSSDNTVVAREVIDRGVEIPSEGVTTRDKIPAGNKLATRRITKGEPIVKYNITVGFAGEDIEAGTWLHNHNTEFREFDRDYAHASEYRPINVMPESEQATFQGIARDDGMWFCMQTPLHQHLPQLHVHKGVGPSTHKSRLWYVYNPSS